MRSFLSVTLIFFFSIFSLEAALVYKTIFGALEIEDPLVEKIVEHKGFARLKGVDQSGIGAYTEIPFCPPYSRFDHSLGVYHLLKMYSKDREEHIAGLLHDASHTVFSHTADWLFVKDHENAYQDEIHHWYLKESGLEDLLLSNGISQQVCFLKEGAFPCLEQSLPDLCADRIEYNLHTALLWNLISQEDVAFILENLRFENDVWFFVDKEAALLLGNVSLFLTENFWAHPYGIVENFLFAKVLREGLSCGFLDAETIHFGEDLFVLDLLKGDKSVPVSLLLQTILAKKIIYTLVSRDDICDYQYTPKFRGVDPLISLEGSFQRLTELDSIYRDSYYAVKNLCAQGFFYQISWDSLR